MKSCPFCGSKELELCRTNENACWVRCAKCGAESPSAKKRDDAIAVWNTRVESNDNAVFVEDDENVE